MEKAHEALKEVFGFTAFRPMQSDIIEAIFQGKDVFVLMPTGGGKSLCYQIPAITLPGCCVVVSPLISLMKDQVEALRANGVKAAFLNSSITTGEQRQVEDDFFNDNLDLLYVSPEKLVSQEFFPLLQQAPINLFAIDEAHCISSWGHDFRPEYTQLNFLRQQFPNISVVALTATADRLTRQDIVDQLNLQSPKVFVASFDRPNLSLQVRPGQKRLQQILDFIEDRPNQSGIVYCMSRKSTEELANKLRAKGIKADAYHAGLPAAVRSAVQEAFVEDSTPVICATVAFGMGIDKSNVRWVMHYNLPKNVESFYQEIGRAGRDGLPSDTLLFYSYADVNILKEILTKQPSEQQDLKLAKLDRMYQYATAPICRRRTLLSYFGEELKENCGNCDVCKNPPEFFDGTEIAQKALSAIVRLKESVGMNMLINVLRGSGQRVIFERGYHQIKTYGAGRDLGYMDWQRYIEQLLNLGLIEIAHERHNALQLTTQSKAVLFEGEKVELVKPEVIKKRTEKEKKQAKAKRRTIKSELFEALRELRTVIARQKGVPPYIIFSDATLEDMAKKKPLTDAAMENVSGVGARKLHLYGDDFIEVIRDFVKAKTEEGIKVTGSTYIETLELLKSGKDTKEIALERGLSETTIFTHIGKLYEQGEIVSLDKYISEEELRIIQAVLSEFDVEELGIKPIYDKLNGAYTYNQIRLAISHRNRHEKANG